MHWLQIPSSLAKHAEALSLSQLFPQFAVFLRGLIDHESPNSMTHVRSLILLSLLFTPIVPKPDVPALTRALIAHTVSLREWATNLLTTTLSRYSDIIRDMTRNLLKGVISAANFIPYSDASLTRTRPYLQFFALLSETARGFPLPVPRALPLPQTTRRTPPYAPFLPDVSRFPLRDSVRFQAAGDPFRLPPARPLPIENIAAISALPVPHS
jgi:hypothetical protein